MTTLIILIALLIICFIALFFIIKEAIRSYKNEKKDHYNSEEEAWKGFENKLKKRIQK